MQQIDKARLDKNSSSIYIFGLNVVSVSVTKMQYNIFEWFAIYLTLAISFLRSELLYEIRHSSFLKETNIKYYDNLSLQMCIRKCSELTSCFSVNFWRRFLSCYLLSTNNLHSSNVEQKNGCTHVLLIQVGAFLSFYEYKVKILVHVCIQCC